MARVNLKPVIKAATKFAKKHAPKILAGVAIISNGFGYYFMHKAAPKVHENLKQLPEDAKFWDKIKAFGPYWGALAMFITSSGSTIGSVIMGDKIAAGLATLCSMTKAELEQVKDKLIETVGPEKAQEMNDQVYQEAAKQNYPKTKSEIKNTCHGNVLFYEPKTGQWFRSSVGAVEDAKTWYNNTIINRCEFLEFSEFLNLLEIEPADFGEIFGNNNDHLLDFTLIPSKRYEDMELYYTISYATYGEPVLYNGHRMAAYRTCKDGYPPDV